ncbi:MAG: ATP synthase beta subunit C-terminal domain-containing protein, partial [Alphaproteobacteria bacterium]
TRRFVRAFWALDKALASARHFPSINWNDSYSEYVDEVGGWWKNVDANFDYKKMRDKAMEILQEENKLAQVVKLVGSDALPDKQRILLNTSMLIKESFLQQNAFHKNDVYCSPEKQLRMMDIILYFHEKANATILKGVPSVRILELEILTQIIRMKTNFSNDELDKISKLKEEIDYVLENM